MVGVGWVLTIVIGAVAGFLAEKIMKANHGLLTNILLGVGGAIVLNFLLGVVLNFHWGGIIGQLVIATAGACGLIFVYRAIKGRG